MTQKLMESLKIQVLFEEWLKIFEGVLLQYSNENEQGPIEKKNCKGILIWIRKRRRKEKEKEKRYLCFLWVELCS